MPPEQVAYGAEKYVYFWALKRTLDGEDAEELDAAEHALLM
jgi:hypothetical protein